MNQEVKQKWTRALRQSKVGKKKIQQGHFGLHPTENAFCVLGVLCEIYSQEANLPWVKNGSGDRVAFSFLGQKAFLPQVVITWAGMNSIERNDVDKLSLKNDVGVSFSVLADTIERML